MEVHTVSLPGSLTETYGYDNAGRVKSYSVAHSGTSLISDNYSYFTSGGTDANLLESANGTTEGGSGGYSAGGSRDLRDSHQ